ncbi:hypothetical protein SAMD00019534_115760, partial [Acytostelium subglobosum LB1]|uniref:hypothetical protein n=1 Tax=Acytostelium subglobosum LB1 TaxID=1410327 RepID=UPI000644C235
MIEQLHNNALKCIVHCLDGEKLGSLDIMSLSLTCKRLFILLNSSNISSINPLLKGTHRIHYNNNNNNNKKSKSNKLSNIVISSLKTIRFDDSFNQSIPIGHLPPTLTKLKLGDHFNQRIIPGSLPESLVDLTFGNHFNKSLQWRSSRLSSLLGVITKSSRSSAVPTPSLPQSITRLTFGSRYNKPVEHYQSDVAGTLLPQSLTKLIFGDDFIQPLPANSLPLSLEVLKFGCWYDQSCMAAVTQLQSLRILAFASPIHFRDNPPRPHQRGDPTHTFPASLTSLLTTPHGINDLLLPQTLRVLLLAGLKTDIVPGMLPPLLETLILIDFNSLIEPHSLPNSLTILELGSSFDREVIEPGVLPNSLVILVSGTSFNQVIGPDVLPKGLKSLTLGQFFDKAFRPGTLPESLTSFSSYTFNLKAESLPSSIVNLAVGISLIHQSPEHLPNLKYLHLKSLDNLNSDHMEMVSMWTL